jgi:peptidoglycan/xylan/chitin deacetylase (PgdA/CDA1 family)
MKRLVEIAIGLAACALAASAASAANNWPDGAKAAIVLTYDDALTSQLDHAVPVLEAAGFRGTFFLSNVKAADIPRWRKAAADGHELGNHTIFHACAAANYPADPRYTAEAYTPASLLKEIEQQNVLLTAIDGKKRHGFATPCGQSKAGGTDYLETLRAADLVDYVRGVFVTPADLAADVAGMDPMRIPARGFPDDVTGAQLIDFVRQAEAGGGMGVLLFHGVGGDYLQVSDAAHRELIDWLKAHRKDVWVTNFKSALDWAKAHPGSR